MSRRIIGLFFLLVVIMVLISPTIAMAMSKVNLGDINCDGMVDLLDVQLMLKHISSTTSNQNEGWMLLGERARIADVTQDGLIDSRDMLALIRYISASTSSKVSEEHPEWMELKEIEIDKNELAELEEKEEIIEEQIIQEEKEIEKTTDVMAETKEVAPTSVELSMESGTINVGISKIIEGKVSPTNATNKNVSFSSSNTSIATVGSVSGKGTYYIKTAVNDRVISIDGEKKNNGTNVITRDNKKLESQKFDLIDAGNGYYIIRIKHSGKVLDVQREGKENSTNIIQYHLTGNDNQLWKLEDAGNGYYYIKSKDSGLYLDVQGGKANNGSKLIIYQSNKKDNQKFKLVGTGETPNFSAMNMIKVTAKKEGTATITAKTSNGKTAKCTITVKSKITGGEAIAKAAVKLACTVSVSSVDNGRLLVTWADTRSNDPRAATYIKIRERLIPMNASSDDGEYASCDMAVATAVRYSKVDTKMEFNTIPNIWTYLKKSSNWNNVGTYRRPNSASNLKPGDVLISGEPYGHIFIYTGNKIVKLRDSSSNADAYEAGYSSDRGQSYYPRLFAVTKDTRNNISYTIFRHKNWDKELYDDINI